MSYQFIIDNASSIQITNKALVANTVTRTGVVRSVVRNHQPWSFTVDFPRGPRWTDYRTLIGAINKLDRYEPDYINFAQSDLSWMFQFQGTLPASPIATWVAGVPYFQFSNSLGFSCKAGDLFQLGNYVYQCTQATSGNNLIYLHRPIITSGSGTVLIGTAVTFQVKCVELPDPVIFDRDQFGFTGPFRFVESFPQ